ncbi:4-(cytidine 5'-diphospho)-2-C-methyl-D-erythritol kinase [Alteripontixanthobacter maritimus]|uniref:4-(Cytidine 5'-diphospho)-2-C-methyl-D-erythritol kinase n=1 Tax=Alteripontixanthobacter maritimus TaxID=2161824 RepID=A0A369Q6L6_9SPHN|nr:GNAT family N-acetyltransferase [Alteripontixanthobacter maritimus]RDC60513.1 4-(cytidine 5'-diphospho)-2-C-methyl-D-erythritol kinase [Alteripontixanthobacter maritimus]
MSADWRIRLARPDDAQAFHDVEADAGGLLEQHPSLAQITLPSPRSSQEYAAMIDKGHSLAAVSEDAVIGFVATRPFGRELHIHELSVRRSFQRRGIGATLLGALAIDAHNAGFAALTLNTFRDIPWNAPFYARQGFEIIGDIEAHPRLAHALEKAVAARLPRENRCAMIRFLG